ncbi:Pantetheinase [Halotydeus destructor]|nr:Pantetheinase [Halotydeus destructor]
MASSKCICLAIVIVAAIAIGFAVTFFLVSDEGIQDGCFRAAAYEHVLLDSVDKNLRAYRWAVGVAANKGASIIVLPENGLFSPPPLRDDLKEYLETVPAASRNISPCEFFGDGDNDDDEIDDAIEEDDDHRILRAMSCLARRYRIYIVFDMGELVPCTNETTPNCPKDGAFMYNTQLALDPNGFLVAIYHKRNLYGELYYNTPEPEHITFDTPFGKMGLFICFDMLFKDPAVTLVEQYGVDTMLFSTHWYDQHPFLAAHQYQQGFAFTNQVNVIASNRKEMRRGTTGSGIYAGQNGAVVVEHSIHTGASSKLMIANIAIDSRSGLVCDPHVETIDLDMFIDKTDYNGYNTYPLDHFQYVKLNHSAANVTVCSEGMCCHLEYEIATSLSHLTNYYFIALNGSHFGGNREWCEEQCAIVAYDMATGLYSTQENITFEHIRVRANFSTDYVYPHVVTNDYAIVSAIAYQAGFINGTANYELAYEGGEVVTNAGLLGRCYDRDGEMKIN